MTIVLEFNVQTIFNLLKFYDSPLLSTCDVVNVEPANDHVPDEVFVGPVKDDDAVDSDNSVYSESEDFTGKPGDWDGDDLGVMMGQTHANRRKLRLVVHGFVKSISMTRGLLVGRLSHRRWRRWDSPGR
jgi:hypothetical protein